MTRLGNFSWSPKVWVNAANRSFTSSEINKTAVLKNVRRTGSDLILFAGHDGVVYTGKIGTQPSEDFLIVLRHILLQHWGELLSDVEDPEVNFHGLAVP